MLNFEDDNDIVPEAIMVGKVLETRPVGWSNRTSRIIHHLRKVSDFDSVVMLTEEKENIDNADG